MHITAIRCGVLRGSPGRRHQRHPKTDDVIPIVGNVPDAESRPTVLGIEEPRPATQHARSTMYIVDRIGGVHLLIVFLVRVLTPLPHIPVHVVEPKRIRFLAANRMRRVLAVCAIPRHGVQVAVCIPGIESRLGSRPTGKLPFCFRGQSCLNRLCPQPLVELFTERRGVVP